MRLALLEAMPLTDTPPIHNTQYRKQPSLDTIMKVNDINFGAHRADAVRRKAVEPEESTSASAAVKESSELKGASKTDRVEISDAAREASGDQEQVKREIEFARRALYNIPPMSKDRAQELLKSLDQGHYNAPDVRMKLAQSLANELAPNTPEVGGKAETA